MGEIALLKRLKSNRITRYMDSIKTKVQQRTTHVPSANVPYFLGKCAVFPLHTCRISYLFHEFSLGIIVHRDRVCGRRIAC